MGILAPDELSGINPREQALLATGLSMMANAGPSRIPVSFGSVIGKAGLEGMGVYQQSLESLRKLSQTQALIDLEKSKDQLTKLQIQQLQRQLDMRDALLAPFLARMRGAGGVGPLGPSGPSVMQGSGSMPAWATPSPSAPAPGGSPLAPHGGGGFNLSPEEVFALKAGQVGDFTELYRHMNTPQQMTAGSYSRDPASGAERFLPDPYKDLGYLYRAALNEAQAKSEYGEPKPFSTARGDFLLTPPQARQFALTGALPSDQAAPSAAPAAQRLLKVSGELPGAEQPTPRPLVAGALQTPAQQAAEKATAEGKAKLELERPQVAARIREQFTTLDRLKTSAQALLDSPGLPRITGLLSKAPNMPGSAGADAAGLLTNLQSQTFIKALADMRASSPTGGAVGNVSDKEGDRLTNSLVALDPRMSTEAVRTELRKLINDVSGAKGRIRRAFGETYGKEHARQIPLTADEILNSY